MIENDARALDQKTQAELRRRAHILHKQGKFSQEIADALGFHIKTVDRWRADFRRDGAAALRPKKRGRKEGFERTLTSERCIGSASIGKNLGVSYGMGGLVLTVDFAL